MRRRLKGGRNGRGRSKQEGMPDRSTQTRKKVKEGVFYWTF